MKLQYTSIFRYLYFFKDSELNFFPWDSFRFIFLRLALSLK